MDRLHEIIANRVLKYFSTRIRLSVVYLFNIMMIIRQQPAGKWKRFMINMMSLM